MRNDGAKFMIGRASAWSCESGPWRIAALFFSLILTPLVAHGDVVIETVGVVKQHFVTSREVQIHYLLSELVFADAPGADQGKVPAAGSEEFRRELNGVLLEWMVYFEARSFAMEPVSAQEIQRYNQLVRERLAQKKAWQDLEVGATEAREFLERALWAKKFIQFKADSARVLPTDDEARQYFRDHPNQFPGHSFAYYEKSIKNLLRKEQANDRLKSWFQVLEKRYQARSLISGPKKTEASR